MSNWPGDMLNTGGLKKFSKEVHSQISMGGLFGELARLQAIAEREAADRGGKWSREGSKAIASRK